MRETASITHERHIYNYTGHFPAPRIFTLPFTQNPGEIGQFFLKFFLFYKKGGNFAG